MTATIIRSPDAMADVSRPRLERDPVLGLEQWLWCFDFTSDWCNPSVSAAPENGTLFRNMARDFVAPGTQAPDAVLRNPGGSITQAANRGGLVFPAGTKDVTDYVEIGGDYMDFSANNDDYLAIVWDLQPLSGFNTSSFQPMLWDTSNNANTASLWIDSGAGGEVVRGVIGNGSGSSAAASDQGLGQGAARQIAFSRVGDQIDLYINGSFVSGFGAAPATLQSTDGGFLTKLAANHTGKIFKTAGCRLGGDYDRSVADIVARDWAAKPRGLR